MLYIVSTPIGNLGDISLRALEVLGQADLILTEDTRKTGLLLKKFGIEHKSLLSFFEHNEETRIPQIIKKFQKGKKIVLTSSAGVPLVSDPGFKLVRACIEQKIPFTCLPGPSSVINALVLSGLSTHNFLFLGFLPRKKGKRITKLEELKELSATIILFENPQRIKKILLEIKEVLGNRRISIVREMTKKFEEVIRGNVLEVEKTLSDRKLKGECTLVIQGKNKKKQESYQSTLENS